GCGATRTRPPRSSRTPWTTAASGWTTGNPPPPTLVTARMDTLDALDLHAPFTDLAGLLGGLGDHRSLDVRRASALGMLAHPQRALDLATGTDPGADPGTDAGSGAGPGAGWNGSRGTLYLHVSLADLATGSGGGRVERLGTA